MKQRARLLFAGVTGYDRYSDDRVSLFRWVSTSAAVRLMKIFNRFRPIGACCWCI